MVFELDDTAKVQSLFNGWEETFIYSCMQKVMGKVFVTNPEDPMSAMAQVGCFAFLAGMPEKELVLAKPRGFAILTPQNEEWAGLIEACFPDSQRVIRYAFRKNTKFDITYLQTLVEDFRKSRGPEGYVLKPIDDELYDQCLLDPVTSDFVSSFDNKEQYLELGRGMVILKGGQIAAGASSYARYLDGIEIEVDTVKEERRKGLAAVCCAALILRCLEEGLYPSWDAQNMNSVRLAEKLGYEFDHEYTAYEVSGEDRTH